MNAKNGVLRCFENVKGMNKVRGKKSRERQVNKWKNRYRAQRGASMEEYLVLGKD